ncbi:MAG: cellulase family glycosylhydrolase [Acidobacteriota bacterium]
MRKTILFLSTVLLSTAMLQAQSQASTPNPPTPSWNHCAENPPGPISRQNDVGNPAGPTGFLLPRGYFHTCGSQIVDEKGSPVRIASVGWPGYDGNGYVFRGLYSVNWQSTMRSMVADGFNTIRIPWNDLLITENPPPYPNQIDFTLNPDLVGLSGMQILDKVVAYAGKIGLRIIFDHHTNDGGHDGNGGQQPNGLWFDLGPGTNGTDGGGNPGTITAAQFEKDTLALAMHYRNSPAVIGYDLDNEPLGVGVDNETLNWGQGGPTDIWQMYTTVGNALLKINPHFLIVCEGPQTHDWNPPNGMADIGPEGDLTAVGGVNGAAKKPVVLHIPNQVVYSVHEYGPEVDDFGVNEQPSTLIPHMNAAWGYLVTQHIAPVWIGEMGSSLDSPVEQNWAQAMVDYMNGKYGAAGGPVFVGNQQGIGGDWWLWGEFDGEVPDGTLEDDWKTPRPDQKAITDQISYFPAYPYRW